MAKYYKPTGRSGTGGRFQELQTGGQTSVERIRQQTQPHIDALRQQQSQSLRYANDWLQSRQRADTVEVRNKKDLKDLEDLIWKTKARAEERVATADIDRLNGKAKEYGKQKDFWLNFSTTYAKQYGEAAEDLYSDIAEAYAERDFAELHSTNKTEGLIPDDDHLARKFGLDPNEERYWTTDDEVDDPIRNDFERKRDEVRGEIERLTLKKGPLTVDEKEYVKANLKLLGNTSYELQEKLVEYEIENSDTRFAQLKQLLGEKYNPEEAPALANRLAFLVTQRTGITNVKLQRKLVNHYRKEANSAATTAYNVRHSKETTQTADDQVTSFIRKPDSNNLNVALNSILAIEDKQGNRLYPNPRAALSYLMEQGAEHFDDADELINSFADSCTLGTGPGSTQKCVTWKERYSKGDGKAWLSIVDEASDAIYEARRERLQKDRVQTQYEDTENASMYSSRFELYQDWKLNHPDLSLEDYMEQKGITDPKLGPLDPNGREIQNISKGLGSGDTKQKEVVSTILANSTSALNIDRFLAEVGGAFRRGDESYGEFLLSSIDPGLLTDTKRAKLRANSELNYIANRSGIFTDKSLRDGAKDIILSKAKIKLKTANEDETVGIAVDLYMQSLYYYFFDDPGIAEDQTLTPQARLQKAKEAVEADIQEGRGLWMVIEPGDNDDPSVLSSYFPALKARGTHWDDKGVLTKTSFEIKLKNNTHIWSKDGKSEKTHWWLRPTQKLGSNNSYIEWLGDTEAQDYAKMVLYGQSDQITYSKRVQQISKASGLYPHQVVNLVFERLGYTERIPTDTEEYADVYRIAAEKGWRVIEGIADRIKGGKDHYSSKDSNNTRLLYYKLMYLYNKRKVEEANNGN